MGVTWLLATCCFALGCSQQFIMGIPSDIAASLGVSVAAVGQLMTAFSLASAVGTPILLAGTSHKLTPRSQMLLGLGLMVLGLIAFSFISNYVTLLAARVVMGVGNGTFTSTAMAIAATSAKPGHQASALSNVSLGFSAAMVLGMPIARTVAPFIGWHALYGILSAVAVLIAFAIFKLVPNSGREMLTAEKPPTLKERFSPLANRTIVFALVVMVLINLGFSSFYTYVTPFLENTFGTADHTVSMVLLISSLMSIVGIKGSGWLADHTGCKRTATAALCVQILSLSVLGAYHEVGIVVWVAMCVWVTSDWSFNPSQNLMLTRLAENNASLVLGLSGSALQLGSALGSAAGGIFIETAPVGFLPFLSVIAIFIALMIELFFVFRGMKPSIYSSQA
ncbi:MAG: MFS transporter [Coriobacteriales bacterium]|nr:MFS transporter [Coriobacteriales bacterium]